MVAEEGSPLLAEVKLLRDGNDLIRLFDSGQSDEAIGKVFCDEVYAIEAHRKFTENDFSSLVAILRSYIDKGIVSQSKADEIASWMHGRI